MDNTWVQFGLSALLAGAVGVGVYFFLGWLEKRLAVGAEERAAEVEAKTKQKKAANAVDENKAKYGEILQARHLETTTRYETPEGEIKRVDPKEKTPKFLKNDFGELVVPEHRPINPLPKKQSKAQRKKNNSKGKR